MLPETEQFSEKLFAWQRGKDEFEDALAELGFESFKEIGGDYYDSSIEFYGVANDARLSEDQQRLIHSHGFIRAYVNHEDGYETHYTWPNEFAPHAGHRVLYPHKQRRVTV